MLNLWPCANAFQLCNYLCTTLYLQNVIYKLYIHYKMSWAGVVIKLMGYYRSFNYLSIHKGEDCARHWANPPSTNSKNRRKPINWILTIFKVWKFMNLFYLLSFNFIFSWSSGHKKIGGSQKQSICSAERFCHPLGQIPHCRALQALQKFGWRNGLIGKFHRWVSTSRVCLCVFSSPSFPVLLRFI